MQYTGLFDWVKSFWNKIKQTLHLGEKYVDWIEDVRPLRCRGCFECLNRYSKRWIPCYLTNIGNRTGLNLTIREGYLVLTYKKDGTTYYYRIPEKYMNCKRTMSVITSCTIPVNTVIVYPKSLFVIEKSDGTVVYKAPEEKTPPPPPPPLPTQPQQLPSIKALAQSQPAPQLPPTPTPTQPIVANIPKPQPAQERVIVVKEGGISKYLPFLLAIPVVILLLQRGKKE